MPRSRLGAEVDGDEVVLRVADSGPGVPESFVPHLFERFSRSETARSGDHKGTGLGLYISRRLLRANGGDLCYEAGRGATFCVRLPRVAV